MLQAGCLCPGAACTQSMLPAAPSTPPALHLHPNHDTCTLTNIKGAYVFL